MTAHVTVAEAADLLSVDPSRIRHMVRDGKLRTERIDGRTYRVNLADVRTVLRGRKRRDSSPSGRRTTVLH